MAVKTAYEPPLIAAQQMVEAQTPAGMAAREAARTAAEPYLVKLDPGKVASMISGSVIPYQSAGAPIQKASMALMSEYGNIYRDIYSRIGDQSQAEQLTVKALQTTWGQSDYSGKTWFSGGALMKYPPEQVTNPRTGQPYYPAVNGGHDYIADQINAEINGYVQHAHPGWSEGQQGEEARAMLGNPRYLFPDPETSNEVATGRPPGYLLLVQGTDGRLAVVPDPATGMARRVHFDPGPAQQASDQAFTAARRDYFGNQTRPDITGRPMPMDAASP